MGEGLTYSEGFNGSKLLHDSFFLGEIGSSDSQCGGGDNG
jgi:hypothetical protein